MYRSQQIANKNKILLIGAALIAAVVLFAASFLSPIVSASSLASVSSNISEVPGGANLVLRVAAQNDGNLAELEIDHSMSSTLPEFSVYANATNPYGGSDCGPASDTDCVAAFAAMGVTVTYNAASSEWVIDFGAVVTQQIRDNDEGINFYFVLRDADRNILWGSMDSVTPENTFSFDAVAGTGDSLEAEAEEEVIVPGVPNTSVVL